MITTKSTAHFQKYLRVAPFSHALWRAGEAESLQSIKLKPPILDIGCGFGEFAGVFFNQMLEMGIDINQKDLVLAAQKKKYQNLVIADARQLPFPDNSFNTLISISTMEHINNADLVLKEGYRVLKKGGRFIYTVPTKAINELLFGAKVLKAVGMDKMYIDLFHRSFHHHTLIGKNKWLDLTKKAGFKILNTKGTICQKQIKYYELGLPGAWFTQINRLFFKKRLLFSPQWRINVLTKLYQKLATSKSLTEANIAVLAEK